MPEIGHQIKKVLRTFSKLQSSDAKLYLPLP